MSLCITNGKVVLKDEIIQKNILIDSGIIVRISDDIEEDATILDAKGNYVCPGLIDVHTHGKAGKDTMEGTFEALEVMSKANARTGVTSFLPTTMTYGINETQNAIEAVRKHGKDVSGARILGVHMEGPFFNEKFKGAQPAKYLQLPSIEAYEELVNHSDDKIIMMSIAPEKEGADTLIPYLVNKGIVVSVGHTGASYEEVEKAFSLGANHATHTYNAMSGFNHRAPNCVGAVLNSEDVYAELILDGIHVDFNAARLLLKSVGKEHLVLITDSMEAALLEDGQYQLGGQDVYVKNRKAVLADGTIAGSVLSLNEAVRNAKEQFHLSMPEAINLASLNPAKSIKQEKMAGSIEVGKYGDIIIVDENINVLHTIVEGNMKF